MTAVNTQSSDEGSGLRPPQFNLATLLGVTTVLAVLFAVMGSIGPYLSALLVLFLSLVVAHVAGNALGTKLRDQAPARPTRDEAATAARDAAQVQKCIGNSSRRLIERDGLNGTIIVVAIGGAASGAVLGGSGLAAMDYAHLSLSAIALGTISSAVLGGFAGFLAASFFSVFGRALREAQRGADPPAMPGQTGPLGP